MIDGLAFLPLIDVPKGMKFLIISITIMPQEAADLIHYFDSTYVRGKIKIITNSK